MAIAHTFHPRPRREWMIPATAPNITGRLPPGSTPPVRVPNTPRAHLFPRRVHTGQGVLPGEAAVRWPIMKEHESEHGMRCPGAFGETAPARPVRARWSGRWQGAPPAREVGS